MTPTVVRQMDPTRLTVRVSDADGHPLSGVSVGAELTMPSMEMGRDAVVLSQTAPGVYSGTGRFSMDGDWVVAVTVSLGADKTTQSFPLHVR